MHVIKNKVGIIKEKPPSPKTKLGPGLSNIVAVNKKEMVKTGIICIRNPKSFLTKGTAKIKIPIGITKNWIPPHDASPKPNTIPPVIILVKAIFLFSDLKPLRKKYNPNNPKNNPSGSDLNQPKVPRNITGKDTEKNKAAKRPAVVPPKTLTSAKIMTTVNEPTTTGNKIVKSYNEELPPKI